MGTDPLVFSELPQANITVLNGVQKVGNDIQIDLSDTNPSLEVADGGLRSKVDDSTIERTANGLAIKDSGVTNAKLQTVGVAKGGTNLTALGTANQVLGVNNGATGLEYKDIVGGANVTVTHGANEIEIAASISGAGDYIYTEKEAIAATPQTAASMD